MNEKYHQNMNSIFFQFHKFQNSDPDDNIFIPYIIRLQKRGTEYK